MDQSRIVAVSFIAIAVLATSFYLLYSEKSENRERSFLEIKMEIINPAAKEIEHTPGRYGIIVKREYGMTVIVEKFMGNLDDQMQLSVFLPDNVLRVEGPLNWTGSDRRHVIEIRFIANKTGDFTIDVHARRYGKDLKTTFQTQAELLVFARNTSEEASAACMVPRTATTATYVQTNQTRTK
jgi:hypothetical protein